MKRKKRRVRPLGVSTDVLRAGAARVDITPALGIPNGGYGIWGAIQTGVWQRLHASVLVLETPATSDQGSRRVALVGCDLHAGTRYLHEAVAERTASLGISVDRLLIGASHTHYGPSGIYCDDFYDKQAGAEAGFNQNVMNWLTGQLHLAISRACDDLRPAQVGHGEARVWGHCQNRSLPAFAANGVSPTDFARQFSSNGADWTGLSDDKLAVDPRVRVTLATTPSGEPIGAFGTINAHNTSLLPMRRQLSSDWFGWAVRSAQQKLFNRGGAWSASARLPLGIVYGNAGDANATADVTDEYTTRQSRELTRLLGERYGDALAEACVNAASNATPDVRVRTRWVEALATRSEPSLAPGPKVGGPTLGGAEGLRVAYEHPNEWIQISSPTFRELKRRLSMWLERNCPEPALSERPGGPHFPKKVFPEEVPRIADRNLKSMLKSMQGEANSLFPIRVFSVGDHHWVGVPGEPTAFAGQQLERAAVDELGGTAAVVGVCGDYIGYFTTRSEYDTQHYEGSSTLWGPNTTDWLEARVRAIARRPPTSHPTGFAEFHNSKVWKMDRERRRGEWGSPSVTEEPQHQRWTVRWRSPKLSVWLGDGPMVQLERQNGSPGRPVMFRGAPVNDQEYPIEIRRIETKKGFVWVAYFRPDPELRDDLRDEQFRFRIVHHRFGDLDRAVTDRFEL